MRPSRQRDAHRSGPFFTIQCLTATFACIAPPELGNLDFHTIDWEIFGQPEPESSASSSASAGDPTVDIETSASQLNDESDQSADFGQTHSIDIDV
ncbi:hypothetical protein DFH05DRAFT_1518462 [Lentinula detonsa]|uniref:Uncharacterized protein n=1 Tax=Lentinula detonsa TaxID=2804962 RepID=A0A9W8PAK7_9AGAR|nr:hypothetical protein DFH05DRAFT_1518462 [Lentinula detonsa]